MGRVVEDQGTRLLVIEVEQTKGAADASYVRDILDLKAGNLLLRLAAQCVTARFQGRAEVAAEGGSTTLQLSLHLPS